jgi:hypothetical protein
MKYRDRTKIDESDLASVHVASLDRVADACGGSAAHHARATSGTKSTPRKSHASKR